MLMYHQQVFLSVPLYHHLSFLTITKGLPNPIGIRRPSLTLPYANKDGRNRLICGMKVISSSEMIMHR